MSKVAKLTSFSGRFVKCPLEILTRSDVSSAALKAWLLIKMHSDNGEPCPSIRRLSEHLGLQERQTRRLIDNLAEQNLLAKQWRKGTSSVYSLPKIPKHPKVAPVTDDRTPRSCMTDKERIRREKKEESTSPDGEARPQVKSDSTRVYEKFIELRRRETQEPKWQPSAKQAIQMRTNIKDHLQRCSADSLCLCLQHYFEDPRMKEKGYPWGLFAHDPVGWKMPKGHKQQRYEGPTDEDLMRRPEQIR